LKFWRLLAQGQFRQAWEVLSRRPDSEHEQALIRAVITALLFFYLSWSMSRDGGLDPGEVLLLWVCALYHLFSVGLFVRITFAPVAASPFRRSLGLVGDLVLTSYGISVAGDVAGPLYVVLLWVIFGNGFRYGRKYLFAASAIGTVSFGIAIYLNAYWSNHRVLAVGLQVGLVLLPLYISTLLKKLTLAGKRAEEANRAKTRFLANMSHEMRTPLNGIIGMLDLLKETPLSQEQEDLTRTIDDSAHTLLFLMQDVLDLSKIEAGKVSVQVSDIDLYALLKHTVAILEPQARFKGLATSLRISSNVPFLLRGDPLLLRQVLLNLLGNALKFTEKGEVGVRVTLESETQSHAAVRFEVVDTGIGIAPEAQRRIFDRFTQADESITRRFGGTGLGTTISKEIVEMMGGEIGVRSEPGRGSAFWFTLDLEKQRAAQGASGPAASLADRRALILSADPVIAADLHAHLAGWGVLVVTVDRTAQAFAQLVPASKGGVPFDFVLVAVDGMDMDTSGFARAVKSDPTIHDTHLILVTSGKEEAGSVPGDGYSAALPAPVDKTMLFNALHLSRTDATRDAGSCASSWRRTTGRTRW